MKDALDRLLRDGAVRSRVLPLAGGLPADVQFPRLGLAASFLRVIRDPEALQYGWPEGQRALRAQIAARLRARGADLSADDVLITNGAQQAIAIATQLIRRPGDPIGVDQVTYPSALDLFRSLGLSPVTDARATAFYVMPVVGNPGGRQLSPHERRWLVSETRAFLIEDDAYADLCFAGPAHLERTIHALRLAGFRSDDISALFPDKESSRDFALESNTKVPEGAAAGAVSGLVLGGALGWLVGIGAIAIPGLGPFIAAGPLVAALAGAGAGGVVGELAGALIGLGMPEFEAKRYEGLVKSGGILLSVHADNSEWTSKAKNILKNCQVGEISSAGEASADTRSPIGDPSVRSAG